jgi:hypothetical protein
VGWVEGIDGRTLSREEGFGSSPTRWIARKEEDKKDEDFLEIGDTNSKD